MKAAALIEWNGVPIDTATLALLRQYWGDIQDDLIAAVDRDYGVFDGRTFRLERWEHWLSAHGVPWPRLENGRLDLSDDTLPTDGAFASRRLAHARAAQRLVRNAAG